MECLFGPSQKPEHPKKRTRPISSQCGANKAVQQRIYYYGSLQICEQQSLFLTSKHVLQRQKKGTSDFRNVIVTEGFDKIIEKKARTRFLLHTKLSSPQKFSRAVRIGKFGPLNEPIRKLLFSADQFSYMITAG